MAYRIELGHDTAESLYLEIAVRNRYTGALISGESVEHQLAVARWGDDYGQTCRFGQIVASNANGLITSPVDGILCINVPREALCCDFGWNANDRRQSLRFKLLATPIVPQLPLVINPGGFSGEFAGSDFLVTQVVPQPPVFASAFTKTLATGTISFGGTMDPRITLQAYPLYPNAPTASVLTCGVAQLKQQLAQLGLYDQVEAGLGPATDHATISWTTGGDMTLGGPLANRISVILGDAPGAPLDLTALMTAAIRTNI